MSTQCEFDLKSTSMISDQTKCTTQSLNTTLIQPLWYHRIQSVYQYLFDQVARLLKSRNKKAFTSHCVPKTEMRQYRAKMVQLIRNSVSLENERHNLEHKKVLSGNKSHCWKPIRLQGSPVTSKWIIINL